jgi:hypothetical protein
MRYLVFLGALIVVVLLAPVALAAPSSMEDAVQFLYDLKWWFVASGAIFAVLQVLRKVVPELFKKGHVFSQRILPLLPVVLTALCGFVPGIGAPGTSLGVNLLTGLLFGCFAGQVYKFIKGAFGKKEKHEKILRLELKEIGLSVDKVEQVLKLVD